MVLDDGRGQEGVGQVDLAVAVDVPVRGAVAQQLGGGLVDGVGGFAIDREVAATVVQMAEAIDLRVSGAGLRRRHDSLVFYF